MAIDQRASPSPLLLLLLSLLIGAATALASRCRWPFQRCFSSLRCCFSLSGLCFLIHCENNDSLHSSCWPYWSWFWIHEVIVLWRRDYCMIPLSWMSILKDKDVHAFFSLLLPATINLAFVHIASFTDLCFSSLILGATAGLSCGGSDHGMTNNGNHGGSSYEETDSLVLFVGLKHKAYDCPLVIHSTADQTENLLRIAIFNISYIRGLFPEKYFNDKSIPALRDQDQEAYTNGCKVLQTN